MDQRDEADARPSAIDAALEEQERFRRRLSPSPRRRAIRLGGTVLIATAVLVVVGAFTGLPGPVSRPSYFELRALTDRINDSEILSCGGYTGAGNEASIDWLRGRVRVEGGTVINADLSPGDLRLLVDGTRYTEDVHIDCG